MASKFFNEKQLKFLQEGFGYTKRQMQIVKLICAGLNNSGLSNILRITPQTAKTHVRNICRKAHARGRADLILTLLRHSRHIAGLPALRLSKGLLRRSSLGAKPGRPRRPVRRSVSKVRRPLRKKARSPRRPVRRSVSKVRRHLRKKARPSRRPARRP